MYKRQGEDDFSLYRAVKDIKAGLGDAEMLATNTTSLEGQHLTLSELRNKCDAAPFLSSHRLVIVDGLLGRFEVKQGRPRSGKTKSGDGLGEWEGLSSYIKQMPQTTVLVLIDEEIEKSNPLLKELAPLAEVKIFPLLRGRDLKVWIQKRVKEEGGAITPQAVDLLAELVGGDLWAMSCLLYTSPSPRD